MQCANLLMCQCANGLCASAAAELEVERNIGAQQAQGTEY
jgi:hypothetical protein